jgi:hypothetical protein
MQFVAFGLVVSVVLGAIAWSVVNWLTRTRHHASVKRGRLERAIEYGAGIGGGPLALLILGAGGTVGPHYAEEIMMLGPLMMAIAAAAVWVTGELLSGPTRRSLRPMIFAFLAAQAGFVAAIAVLSALARYVLPAIVHEGGLVDALVQSAMLPLPYGAGGFASTWAYRRWRYEMAETS